jgi:hypothetical protein
MNPSHKSGDLTMFRIIQAAAVMMALSLVMGANTADAFWGHRQVVTTNYALPSVPVTAAYAPVVVARPVIASPIVTTSYAPIAAPVTSYYAPATTAYYAPAPVTTYAAAPVTSYYAPAVTSYAAPVTSYYAPAPTYVAPTTSYYAPAYVAPAYVPASTTVIARRPWFLP